VVGINNYTAGVGTWKDDAADDAIEEDSAQFKQIGGPSWADARGYDVTFGIINRQSSQDHKMYVAALRAHSGHHTDSRRTPCICVQSAGAELVDRHDISWEFMFI
jgi:hypothetical protein